MRGKWFRRKVGRVGDVCMLSNNFVPHMAGPHSLCLLIQPYICFPWSLLCLLLISKVPHLDDDVEAQRLCRVVVASFSYYCHGDHGDLHIITKSPLLKLIMYFVMHGSTHWIVHQWILSLASNWPPNQSAMGTLQHKLWCGACWDRKHCQKQAMLSEQYFTPLHEFHWIPPDSHGMLEFQGISMEIPEWFLWIPSGIWMEFLGNSMEIPLKFQNDSK